MAKVAFIGLGVMGFPMAGHLVKKGGHEVTVYNRTAAKAKQWTEKFGGRSAPTPKAAAEGQDFVMCCVGNDNDLRAVTIGADAAFSGIKKGDGGKERLQVRRCPGLRRTGGRGERRADRDVRRQ
jgi:3-hydroxyisobutyrate dehydrogenase